MIIVSYDIQENRLRTQFSKFLEKFGFRMQYSVFQIQNSKRLLAVIESEIKNKFEKRFSQADSVIIIQTNETCKITKWGYAKNDEDEIIVVR